MINFLVTFIIILHIPTFVFPVSIGSNVAFSRQATANFPNTDTNNTMLGFAIFPNGFNLTDQTTSCTYDNFFPVSNRVNINQGTLVLRQDFALTNSFNIASGMFVRGNGKYFELGKQLTDVFLPHTFASLSLNTIAQTTMSSAVNSVDWSPDTNYVAAVSQNAASATELRVYYFDGSSLTVTQLAEQQRNVNAVRWNPVANYLAVGRNGISNEELRIYKFNIFNGTFPLTDTRDYGNRNMTAASWHPSGKFLITGDSGSNGQEVRLYSFDLTTGLLNDVSPNGVIGLTPDRAVSNNALSFAPGGNYFAIGTVNSSNAPQLLVSSFSPTTLTITTSVGFGADALAVDWCPTGSYIAVGLGGGSQRLRIYEHTIPAQTLIEVQSARVGETASVASLSWDPTGNFLFVGTSSGISSAVKVYAFDKVSLTLTLVASAASSTAVNTLRVSSDGSYLVRGDAGTNVIVSGLIPAQIYFKDTTLVLNSNTQITRPVRFLGTSRIDGRGSVLKINQGAFISIENGAQLSIEDVVLDSVNNSKIRCVTDRSSLSLRNVGIYLDGTFTFSRGSILFGNEVLFTGGNAFVYSSRVGSTIESNSTLLFDRGTTFSYAPNAARQNLLFMKDITSELFFNGATLFSTRTGLVLSGGTLTIDNRVTFSSLARNSGESIKLKSNLNMNLLGGAYLDLNGIITFDT